jgi:hypothetical protein
MRKNREDAMEHGDIIVGDMSTPRDSAFARGALADHRPARCGAMMLQDCGHGVQSWPQQFIRLVGGHRCPAPVRAVPARNQAVTG